MLSDLFGFFFFSTLSRNYWCFFPLITEGGSGFCSTKLHLLAPFDSTSMETSTSSVAGWELIVSDCSKANQNKNTPKKPLQWETPPPPQHIFLFLNTCRTWSSLVHSIKLMHLRDFIMERITRSPFWILCRFFSPVKLNQDSRLLGPRYHTRLLLNQTN